MSHAFRTLLQPDGYFPWFGYQNHSPTDRLLQEVEYSTPADALRAIEFNGWWLLALSTRFVRQYANRYLN